MSWGPKKQRVVFVEVRGRELRAARGEKKERREGVEEKKIKKKVYGLERLKQ